jgi:hypothetical protein
MLCTAQDAKIYQSTEHAPVPVKVREVGSTNLHKLKRLSMYFRNLLFKEIF